MFLGLRHWAVSRCNYKNCTVHLCRAGDHVLDVVRVTWAVNVRIVTHFCLVLNVGDRNRDTALTLFRCLIDHVEWREWVYIWVSIVQHLSDGSSQRCLAVVDVTDGADVYVRFCPLKLRLCHGGSSWILVLSVRVTFTPAGFLFLLACGPLLAPCLRDNFCLDACGNLGVLRELHGVASTSLSTTTKISHIAEHF
ncbi:unannotated protein [freshwater metagenome]|uniref:Unannotated protein n=1 Tax=freshwater metagenome TaxID=449393 RepID=A0A6J5ZJZ9_9ZZZZ